MTDYPNTDMAPQDLVERTQDGPHAHWSPYDLKLEGARYQRLHEIVSSPDFDQAAASTVIAEIMAFARGFGDGQADSFLADFDGWTEDEFEEDSIAGIRRDELLSDYDEMDYFMYVNRSHRALVEAAATPEAKALVGDLTVDALDAFCRGRDARLEEPARTSAHKR
jgi:hypothetical protein